MKHTKNIITLALVLAGAVTASQAATAGENWANLCAKCHGADGKGQTPVGKKLKVKDYTDAKVQAELKDEEMVKAINDGVGTKMKGFKSELSPAEINDLVAHVRKLKS
jgi:cytochrome c553